jgi:thioredoxin reductase (NADPH)
LEEEFDRQPFLLETNISGIFAAGDVRYGSLKRVGEDPICPAVLGL